MLRAQREKEEEERQKVLEEEQRKKRAEIEARRKIEEEEHKRLELEEAKNRAMLEAKLKKEQEETLKNQQIAEQEKRDHDLALRLAAELGNSEVDPINKSPKKILNTNNSSNSLTSNKKYDLSKWKYAELRDAINTSCDLELLEACREEFHRRLKVYHAWKSKNKKQNDGNENGPTNGHHDASGSPSEERAPQSIISGIDELHISSGNNNAIKKTNGNGKVEQRFFRIPFSRPADQHRGSGDHKKGLWYAHFDGKWIARQMEIYDDKRPVLLLAGVDDMHMCELSLEETGLTMKQGAEILESEFETIWNKNGGVKYLREHNGQISSKYVLQIMQRK